MGLELFIIVIYISIICGARSSTLKYFSAVSLSGLTFSQRLQDEAEETRTSRRSFQSAAPPQLPPPKSFVPKYPNLSRSSYEGPFEDAYWSRWTSFRPNNILAGAKSWIDPVKLKEVAARVGFSNTNRLNAVLEHINGADIGCRGGGRLPTQQKNSPSAVTEGAKLVDNLQDWLQQRIAAGPYTKEEMDAFFPNGFTVNPVKVDIKQITGKSRICLDLSSPHLPADTPAHLPNSVNSGIDNKQFSCTMASLNDLCRVLHSIGAPAVGAKSDWKSAYKHLAVRPEDLCLQVIQCADRYIIELMLVFGASSSPFIFSDTASLIACLAALQSKTPEEYSQMCLDDLMNFSSLWSDTAEKFWTAYRDICSEINVSLADTSSPDKAFAPTTFGEFLGMEMDLFHFTWRIPRGKLDIILNMLAATISGKTEARRQDHIATLVGKIIHYSRAVIHGDSERGFISDLTSKDLPGYSTIRIPPEALDQLVWWYGALPSAYQHSPIPDVRDLFPLSHLNLYTDAAGSSDNSTKKPGAGGVFFDSKPQCFFHFPWKSALQTKLTEETGQFILGTKLSCLESLAILLGISAFPRLCVNQTLVAHCDNLGSCYAYSNRNSRDKYTYCVNKAIYDLTAALNCKFKVVHVRRRSCVPADLADDLSKGKIKSSVDTLGSDSVKSTTFPSSLLSWIAKPYLTRRLGLQIAAELQSNGVPTLRWN